MRERETEIIGHHRSLFTLMFCTILIVGVPLNKKTEEECTKAVVETKQILFSKAIASNN